MIGFHLFSKFVQWLEQVSASNDLDNLIDVIDVRSTHKKEKRFYDITLPSFYIIKVFRVRSGIITDIIREWDVKNPFLSNENFLIQQGFSIRYNQFDKRRPQIKYNWTRFPWEIENRIDVIDVYQQVHIGIASGDLVLKYVIEYVDVNFSYKIRKKEIFGDELTDKEVIDYLSKQKLFVRNYLAKLTNFPSSPHLKIDNTYPKGKVIYDSRFPQTPFNELPNWVD